MRVLIASTQGAGHFNPLRPFLAALTRRGDEALLVVPPLLAGTAEATGHPFRIGADPPAEELAAIWQRFQMVPQAEAAVLANREIFGRLDTAAMLPALEEACDTWRPDLVLRDPCEYASAVAADRRGIPHAQVAISLASAEAYSLDLAAPVLEPYGAGMVRRIRSSPYLTRFPAALDPSPYAVTRRYGLGPTLPSEPLPDWWSGDRTPLVYVTFGSVTGGLSIGTPTVRGAIAAVTGLPLRVLVTVGDAPDATTLGPLPANVHVEAWVSQETVLGHAAAVVCHGGSGTTVGALAAGVPVVVVPLFSDHFANARWVAAAGAGLVVEPAAGSTRALGALADEDVPSLRAAIGTVLADATYRRAARRIAAGMRALPTVDDVLADLATAAGGPAARGR